MKNFTVYKSSAGSGKTFTLVADYLCIALKSNLKNRKFASILALTFTNKAASEMKERILSFLKLLSQYPSVDEKYLPTCQSLFKKITEKTAFSQAEIQVKSKELLEQILHHYSEFSVGTIDSFFHRIIRNFANDLKIPVNFEIETRAEKVFNEAVYRLIEQAVDNEFLMKALIDFAIKKLEDGKSWNIQKLLSKFSVELLKEKGPVMAAELKHLSMQDWLEIIKKINKKINTHENALVNTASEAIAIIEKNELKEEHFAGKSRGIYTYFKRIANKDLNSIIPSNTNLKYFEEGKLYQNKTDKQIIECIKTITPDLTICFNKIVSEIREYKTFYIIQKNIYECALINEINQRAEQYKAEENILFIKDFNEKIFNIIIQEYIPFIYERIGEKYEHLLIDEFQDTSQMQWHNLLPVIEHSLTSQNYNLVVGDAKQAIYRWRNGEVEQFINLPELANEDNNPILEERARILNENYWYERLMVNNRSRKEIVAFNNDFFSYLNEKINNTLVNNVYHPDNLNQQYDDNNTGGMVSINFIHESDLKSDDNIYSRHVERIVRETLAQNYKYKDIAILCRRNFEGCAIARHLTNAGIPVISSDSLLLRTSAEVQFMVALMQYFTDTQHTVAFATVIRYISSYLIEKKNKEMQFHELFKEFDSLNKDFSYFCWKLSKIDIFLNAEKLKLSSLSDWCEEIIRSFDLHKEYNLFVNYFLDKVLEYEQKNNSSIVGFLEYWEEVKRDASVVLSAEADAVQIMTIHKSKGLQFPVVIFPFAESRFRNTNDGLWLNLKNEENYGLPVIYANLSEDFENSNFEKFFTEERNKSVLDHLNVLYVVHTRPSQQLHIITKYEDKKTKSKPNQSFLNYQQWYEEYCKDKKFKFATNNMTYRFGEAKNIVAENNNKKDEQNGVEEDDGSLNLEFISVDWREKIRLSLRTKYGNLEASKSKGKEYGLVIHKILSEIKSKTDVDLILQKALISGLVEDFQYDTIQQKIVALLDNAEIGRYFEPGLYVKTEAEIILPDGKQYRPDRLIFEPNKVTIIDFKTGKESEKHDIQVKQYAALIQEMGYNNVAAFLLYTDENRIEKVI